MKRLPFIFLLVSTALAYDAGYMLFSYEMFDQRQVIYPTYSEFQTTYEDGATNYFDPYIDDGIPYDIEHPFELIYPSSYQYTVVRIKDSNSIKKLYFDIRPAEQRFRQFRVMIGLWADEIPPEYRQDPPARFSFSFFGFEGKNIYAYSDSFYYGRLVCLNEYRDVPTFTHIAMIAPPPPETVVGNPDSGVYFYCKQQIGGVTIIICDDANSIKEAMYDFNNDGIVDWQDFAPLADEWCESQGKFLCDTTGQEDKPDGFVNGLELTEMSKYWLYDRADLFRDGGIDMKDYCIAANNWLKMTRDGNINGSAHLPSEIVNFYDVSMILNRMNRR